MTYKIFDRLGSVAQSWTIVMATLRFQGVIDTSWWIIITPVLAPLLVAIFCIGCVGMVTQGDKK